MRTKKIESIFNISKLQQAIESAKKEIINDYKTNKWFISEDNSNYVVGTLVSGGNGIYSCGIFRELFFDKVPQKLSNPNKCNEEYYEIYQDFDLICSKIEDAIVIPENFTLYIDFNENDGSIELFLTIDINILQEMI